MRKNWGENLTARPKTEEISPTDCGSVLCKYCRLLLILVDKICWMRRPHIWVNQLHYTNKVLEVYLCTVTNNRKRKMGVERKYSDLPWEFFWCLKYFLDILHKMLEISMSNLIISWSSFLVLVRIWVWRPKHSRKASVWMLVSSLSSCYLFPNLFY